MKTLIPVIMSLLFAVAATVALADSLAGAKEHVYEGVLISFEKKHDVTHEETGTGGAIATVTDGKAEDVAIVQVGEAKIEARGFWQMSSFTDGWKPGDKMRVAERRHKILWFVAPSYYVSKL